MGCRDNFGLIVKVCVTSTGLEAPFKCYNIRQLKFYYQPQSGSDYIAPKA